MGECANCRHFRPLRPLSELLMRDLGVSRHEPELMNAYRRMIEDERECQDAEADHRRELVQGRQLEWRHRPMMSDYCGKREREGKFLVAELKNDGGQCRDHEGRLPQPRPCATCRYHNSGDGAARDRQQLNELRRLALNDVVLERGGKDWIDEYHRSIDLKKAQEASQVHAAGKAYQKPSYLPVCLNHRPFDEFVPCAVRNPHAACDDWAAPMSLQEAIAAVAS
jgi:uncharacterized protein YjiS (DUF1127 family)